MKDERMRIQPESHSFILLSSFFSLSVAAITQLTSSSIERCLDRALSSLVKPAVTP